jgi:hypothetical protein
MFAERPAQRIALITNVRVGHLFDLVDLGESVDPVVECVHDSMVLAYPSPWRDQKQ